MTSASSHRIWEDSRAGQKTPQPSASQTLPPISTITVSMPLAPGEKSPAQASMNTLERDSGTWSMPPSARSSTYSSTTNNTNGYHQPSYMVNHALPQSPPTRRVGVTEPQHQPSYSSPMAATQPPSNPILPSINQTFDLPHRPTTDYPESRRSSIDSRMNQGISALAINPASPHHSTNASQTSLVSTLQRERGIIGTYRGPRGGINQPPLSPLGPREHDNRPPGRIAPPISSNPRPETFHADSPIPGQAYAFPDPGVAPNPNQLVSSGRPAPQISSNPRPETFHAENPIPGQPYAFPDPGVARAATVQSSHGNTAPSERHSNQFARRSSIADSINSSLYTTESRLPPGQQELPQNGHHHHSLQHRQVRSLMGEADPANGATPYSRTPELRVTHKLAERKRRSEMKDCFEMLRTRLPSTQNNKSSKWETLSRAIDYINQLEKTVDHCQQETTQLRSEIETMRTTGGPPAQSQNPLARQSSFDRHQGVHPMQPAPVQQQLTPPQSNGSLYTAHYTPNSSVAPPVSHSGPNPSRTLPPLINSSAAPMQGVQYTDDRRDFLPN